MTDTTVTARFARRPSRGVMLGLSWPRLVVLVPCAPALVAGLQFGVAGLIAGGLFCALSLAAAFIYWAGRPAVEWVPEGAVYLYRKAGGQTDYVAKPEEPRPVGTMGLPGDGAALRFYNDEVSGMAMVHDPYRQTLSAVLQVSHPAYVLLAPNTQAQRVAGYGRLAAGLALSGHISSLQVWEAAVPDNGKEVGDWYADHGTHKEDWASEQYSELVSTTAAGGATHRTLVCLSLDMKAAGRSIKDSGGGMAGAAKVLRGEIEALELGLRSAELKFGDWLGEAALARVIRMAYDPTLGGDFLETEPGANLSHAGPMAVSEQWAKLRHDSGWSAVLWISEWPRVEVPASFLHSLIFARGVRKMFTITMRALDTTDALKEIRKEKADWLADQSQKQKSGRVQDLSEEQEYKDIEAREKALIAGHADMLYTGLVAITAETEDELASALRTVEGAAGRACCEVRPVYGRQSQAFMATLPIGRSTF